MFDNLSDMSGMPVVAGLLRMRIVKAIKKHFKIDGFKTMTVYATNGKISYFIDDGPVKSREFDDEDNKESLEQLGFKVTDGQLTITKEKITGFFLDNNGVKHNISI